MESILRRAAIALRQFPKIPSFQIHGSQGPSSRHYLSTKESPGPMPRPKSDPLSTKKPPRPRRRRRYIPPRKKREKPIPKPKIDPIMKTFLKDPKKPRPEHLGQAIFDLRKRLARAVSHGTNIHDRLLMDFGLQPVKGFWVLTDTPAGTWVITNPKKGNIKFVHDDYDEYGRLKTTGPRPIWDVINDHQQYADLLEDACRFVAALREDYGIKPAQPDAAAKRAAWVVPMTRKEKTLQKELEKERARRKKENEEKERRQQLTKVPIIPGLAKRRFEAWRKRMVEGTRDTPPLTYEERNTMIERTREILKSSSTVRQLKAGWLECLEIKVVEKDA